jgi:tRNA pseudouridine38-40 synthase
MPRYFIELAYKGTAYSGFQSQHNANTIQAEVEKAMNILAPGAVKAGDKGLILTGSSRTDAGVHARQNYFHFDTAMEVEEWRDISSPAHLLYKLNALLPGDIVIKALYRVGAEAHCRFDAAGREYKYYIVQHKDPFLRDRAYYFPYRLDMDTMAEAAELLKGYADFSSFSKRNTQVKTFQCRVEESEWLTENGCLVYHVKANRFLRGMVRALTATMLKVGRGKMSVQEFRAVIEAKDCTKASFAVPAHGLFLEAVDYGPAYFEKEAAG